MHSKWADEMLKFSCETRFVCAVDADSSTSPDFKTGCYALYIYFSFPVRFAHFVRVICLTIFPTLAPFTAACAALARPQALKQMPSDRTDRGAE